MPSPFDSVFGASPFASLSASLGAAAMERITLLLNHVIAAEPSEEVMALSIRRL